MIAEIDSRPPTYGPLFGEDRDHAREDVAMLWADGHDSNAIAKASEIPEPIVVQLIHEDMQARRQARSA